MDNTGTENEKIDSASAEVWDGFCKHPPPQLTALVFLFAFWVCFFLPSAQSAAPDSTGDPKRRYRVLEVSPVPNPKETPYPDCLTHILCRPITESGASAGQQVELVFSAFRKRILYPAAKLRPGDEVSLETIPFSEAAAEIQDLKQVNDLPFSQAQILFVSRWDQQEEFVAQLASAPIEIATPSSNRDLIIRTLIAHQGKVTGGVNQDFFFWTHVPAMYEADFWKIPPSKKSALGPLRSIVLFKQHLAKKNIDLVFVPIPRTDTIYPGIATNIEYDAAIDGRINFAVRDLMDSLEAEGVTCVDLTPSFLANSYHEFEGEDYPIYRRNNTHWAPAGARIAARLIADAIKKRPAFDELTSKSPKIPFKETVSLEEHPYSMPVFDRPPSRRQPVEMQPVYRIDTVKDSDRGLLDDSLPGAEIHLLGDSFCNAYGSGPGQAGIHPHLVNSLKTPINKIASASGGSAISPNQFARQADLSKAKIVIWAVCESFLAAPDIWADIPLDRPNTLMLDKLLSRAKLSHTGFGFHLASQQTQGSYISIGTPSSPEMLPEESRILWKNVHIADGAKSAAFTTSTWVEPGSVAPSLPLVDAYPLSWEVWINGTLYDSQKSPPGRKISQQEKWKVKLGKFAGQTLDFELVCRQTQPLQEIPGQPCWILPEIEGAQLANSNPEHAALPNQPIAEAAVENGDPTTQVAKPPMPIPIQVIAFSLVLCLIGLTVARTLRKKQRPPMN